MRPCFLVLDSYFPGSISSRKLVIESAKLNVITAYSQNEAIETLERFPGVDGVVINAQMEGRLSCREVIERLRSVRSDIPIITVSASGHEPCNGEQFHVSSYDPRELLTILEKLRPEFKETIADDGEIGQATRKRLIWDENAPD
jgi:CheY-like chemotaxis protein